MSKWKNNIDKIGIGILVFISMFYFFAVIHPMYIYDSDDWRYISYVRVPFPDIQEWNPTKILPETLLPLSAKFGMILFYPFSHDFIRSISIMFAIVLSLFIMSYCLNFTMLFSELFHLKKAIRFLTAVLILLLSFWPYCNYAESYPYMFGGGSVNGIYNYVIPGLLNAAVVLWLYRQELQKIRGAKGNYSLLFYGFLLLVIYLCIHSNMFHSIILISYVCTELLVSFYFAFLKRGEKKAKKYVSENKLYFLALIVWFVCIFIESKGARAAAAGDTGLFELPVGETIHVFINSIRTLNKSCAWILFSAFILAVLLWIRNRRNRSAEDKIFIRLILKMILSMGITVVYLILLCAKVSPKYMEASGVMFSWLFWIMTIGIGSITYIVGRTNAGQILLPLFMYMLVSAIVNDGKIYADNTSLASSPKAVKEINDRMIEQIVSASEKGEDRVEIFIPMQKSEYWPLDLNYAGEVIANTLYSHGMIEYKMEVTLVMDKSINEKYNIH